jgi:hypothetical protein
MISKYIYIILNILSIGILVFFMYSRMRAARHFENANKDNILLKTGVDGINIYLAVFLTMLIFWRLDTSFALYRGEVHLKTLLSTDAFIVTNCVIIVLYYIINSNTITTSGIAKLHLFNNFRNVIQWQQIVNYHWEENCLIIDYVNDTVVDTYLWRNIPFKDRGDIDAIFNRYLYRTK